MTDLAPQTKTSPDMLDLANAIKQWGRELGFQAVGITDVDLGEHEQHLQSWLARIFHKAAV